RELGSRCFAEEEAHRVHPWRSEDREPQETGRLRLRVLRGYPTVRWRAWLEISRQVKIPVQCLDRIDLLSDAWPKWRPSHGGQLVVPQRRCSSVGVEASGHIQSPTSIVTFNAGISIAGG